MVVSGTPDDRWRDRLVVILAHYEAVLDFPDEDLPNDVVARINKGIAVLSDEVKQHLNDERALDEVFNTLLHFGGLHEVELDEFDLFANDLRTVRIFEYGYPS